MTDANHRAENAPPYQLNDVLKPLQLNDLRRDGVWASSIINGLANFHSDFHLHGQRELSSPIDCVSHGRLGFANQQDVEYAVAAAHAAFREWRLWPAPKRGQVIKAIAESVTQHKQALARLIVLEAGKIESEALGEVQEWIDLCDLAVGQSRQLHGLVIASERFEHQLLEQWHPLGVVGVISAFNFPVAVWAWNAMLALVCGNAVIWKPSEKTPLCAHASVQIVLDVLKRMDAPLGLMQLVQGDHQVGQALVKNQKVALVSATGSCRMGQQVAQQVAARLGRSLLELGGNNALILAPSARLDMALRAIVFAAVGTCGQRCTSLRRLIVHESLLDEVCSRLPQIYASLKIGDPREPDTLLGPLIDGIALQSMKEKIEEAILAGGILLSGGQVIVGVPVGHYVQPTLIRMPMQTALMYEETFAPLLFIVPYSNLMEAIAINNAVPQGLSSAIFTQDQREAELFMSAVGSDCGLANVNVGTSGAEIGGAFGGEKATGGGRESGSDAWKNYMRRSTNTINYSQTLPLAQGVNFDVNPRGESDR
ncbi:aldehyde dehydrogenase family protein [Chitinibacter bivalviorum]|uniref:aldehyde dehydrogenase (NAD(+)) n=1 Tax=Chitinibacter bivalviorum TaxID=2739434 RepID=A0A7H9BIS6_9NEIS|nr:aldehyde dehydrogenase family protein [Chitinibacter bivalviorum]QLG87464.1 aldehyde dehydrogenase family protein [Chitinibacter bivalviorum]